MKRKLSFRNDLPETCFSVLPSSGQLIIIQHGERGYYPSEWDTGNREENREIASSHNARRGITDIQEAAMLAGSMFGWNTPGANPQWYLDNARYVNSNIVQGHIKDPIMSVYYPVSSFLLCYEIMGKQHFYLPMDKLPQELMGQRSQFIMLPDMVCGVPVMPVTATFAQNGSCTIQLEHGSYVVGEAVNQEYGCGIALYYSGRENRRPGEEYGSAKWGDPKELNRKYMNHQHKEANIILTQHVRLGMDGYITQRNMNILVVGGSGSGKTRFFCKPGVYSANCSYLITDPKGELLRASGGLLKNKGYDVKVFNLIDPSQSDCYNPFVYVHNEKDVLTLIDNLIKNTTPRNASSNDPFWEKAEIALDSALMLYLISEAPPEERNFETMLYMMNFAEVREDDDQYRSPLDMLFRALEEEQPNHVAVKQYKVFKQAAGKTAKSILVSAAVRLAAFNIPQYARMTMVDEMDFGSLGEKKRAIFCVIPIADTSMNYLVGMLYTQCFQELYHRADEKHGGRLPVPVRVIQDEWANVAQPESYPKILATCRSYNIGLNIIVQNIQNIKALYEKEWESIIGNCDTLLFLGGGNEPTSLEFIVKLLGKETLATRTRGQTKGRNGSSSTNFQQTGRDMPYLFVKSSVALNLS